MKGMIKWCSSLFDASNPWLAFFVLCSVDKARSKFIMPDQNFYFLKKKKKTKNFNYNVDLSSLARMIFEFEESTALNYKLSQLL